MPSFEVTSVPRRFVVESNCAQCGVLRRSVHKSAELAAQSFSFYSNSPLCKACYVPKKGKTLQTA